METHKETAEKPSACGCRGKPGPGRPPGSPNKATAYAREAIGRLVDEYSPRLRELLDEIEETEGPRAAWDCFMDVVEYHVPKLTRSDTRVTHTAATAEPPTATPESVLAAWRAPPPAPPRPALPLAAMPRAVPVPPAVPATPSECQGAPPRAAREAPVLDMQPDPEGAGVWSVPPPSPEAAQVMASCGWDRVRAEAHAQKGREAAALLEAEHVREREAVRIRDQRQAEVEGL